MMKRTILAIAILAFSAVAQAQDEIDRFNEMMHAGATEEADSLVQAWMERTPTDPELFVARFNLHVKRSMKPMLRLDTSPGKGEQLVITDPDSGEEVGFIGDGVLYEDASLNAGLSVIGEGITLHPDRLDMHLGRIYILGQAERYKEQAVAIVSVLERGDKNEHKWLWSKGEPHPDGRELLIEAIQKHMHAIFSNEDASLEPVAWVSRKFIASFPEHVYGYTNLGGYHAAQQQFPEAMAQFEIAHKLDTTDALVLLNMAHCQEQQGDRKAAIVTYDRVMKLDDAGAREYATERKAALKGKR